jgi:hypothetical protein
MMVDVEMPESLPLDLLLAAVPEGDADDEDESETKTTLVTTWPPEFVVTTAEVTTGATVGVLLAAAGALVGVLVDCAACEVDCCAVDDGFDGVVEACC